MCAWIRTEARERLPIKTLEFKTWSFTTTLCTSRFFGGEVRLNFGPWDRYPNTDPYVDVRFVESDDLRDTL